MAITRLDTAASGTTTTLTYSVSAGTDRGLFVFTCYEDFTAARTVTSMDYGGQAMESIVTANTADTGSQCGASSWFLDDAGIAAASGSVITPTYDSGPSNEMIHAASYENVDQTGGTTTFPANATAETNESTPNPFTTVDLTEVDGGLILGFNADGNTSQRSWQSDMTEQTDTEASSMSSGLADRLSTTNANVTIECTIVGPNRSVAISIRIAEAAGAAVRALFTRINPNASAMI